MAYRELGVKSAKCCAGSAWGSLGCLRHLPLVPLITLITLIDGTRGYLVGYLTGTAGTAQQGICGRNISFIPCQSIVCQKPYKVFKRYGGFTPSGYRALTLRRSNK